MVSTVQRLVKGVTAFAGFLVLAGFGGALHPVGDSLAVFRLPLLCVLALAVIWTNWPRRMRWPIVALCLAGMVPHLPVQAREGGGGEPAGGGGQGGLTLYQQNLLSNRTSSAAWLAYVDRLRPDFLTLQEVGKANLPLLAALRAAYPYQHHCPLGGDLGEAVLSRHPVVAGSAWCSEIDGLAAMQVDTPGGRLWLVSLHISWPWPYRQPAQVAQLLPELAALTGPVVLAGDFNSVGWSHTLRQITKATRTERLGHYTKTYTLPGGLPVGIDHVLAAPGLGQSIETLPRLGSDHKGLWARLNWP